jgi:hypothetical protein
MGSAPAHARDREDREMTDPDKELRAALLAYNALAALDPETQAEELEKRLPEVRERLDAALAATVRKPTAMTVLRNINLVVENESKLPETMGQGAYWVFGEEAECPYKDREKRITWMSGWALACRQDFGNKALDRGGDRVQAMLEGAQSTVKRMTDTILGEVGKIEQP